MNINPNFKLTQLDTKYYILPLGMEVANHHHGIVLNESSLFLWNAICDGHSKAELYEMMIKENDATGDLVDIIKQDIDSFIDSLKRYRIICDNNNTFIKNTDFAQYTGARKPLKIMVSMTDSKQNTPAGSTYSYRKYDINIANINITLTIPHILYCKNFDSFRSFSQDDALCQFLDEEDLYKKYNNKACNDYQIEDEFSNFEKKIETDELAIYENDYEYKAKYFNTNALLSWKLNKQENAAVIKCEKNNADKYKVTDEIFHAIRMIFLICASYENVFAIHSASISYQNRAHLFSAPTGVGKSTHATLWQKLYNTPILNGDLNLIKIENKKAYIYGSPWCGTSSMYTNENIELSTITFLKQNKTNEVKILQKDEKILSIFQRLISPVWNRNMFNNNIEFATNLSEYITCIEYKCNKENEAAKILKEAIDGDFQ